MTDRRRRGPLAALLALALAAPLACERPPAAGIALPDRAPAAGGDAGGLVLEGARDDRPTYWDFGTVAYGTRPEHVFRVRNAGSEPVTIHDLLPSCGCTVPRVAYVAADGTRVEGTKARSGPVLVVPAGAVAEVAIRIETTQVERMNVDKLATVRMRSDSPTNPFLMFELHLVVERHFNAAPARVQLFDAPQSGGRSAEVSVARASPALAARVLGVESVEGPFTATVDETEVLGRPVWVLVVAPEPGLPVGPALGEVRLRTTGADGEGTGAPVVVPVSAQIVPDVALRPPLFLLGARPVGASPALEATLEALVPGERFRVLRVEARGVASEALALEWSPLDADAQGAAARWRIAVAPTAALTAPEFAGRIVIETDHPRHGVIDVPYSGTVR